MMKNEVFLTKKAGTCTEGSKLNIQHGPKIEGARLNEAAQRPPPPRFHEKEKARTLASVSFKTCTEIFRNFAG